MGIGWMIKDCLECNKPKDGIKIKSTDEIEIKKNMVSRKAGRPAKKKE